MNDNSVPLMRREETNKTLMSCVHRELLAFFFLQETGVAAWNLRHGVHAAIENSRDSASSAPFRTVRTVYNTLATQLFPHVLCHVFLHEYAELEYSRRESMFGICAIY